MSEIALAAVYRAVKNKLSNTGDGWDGRVYANRPYIGSVRPYVVYQWQGGGQQNTVRRQDAEIVLIVRVVSEAQAEAFALVARLSALLDDMGELDNRRDGAAPLNGGDSWQILTTTQETDIHLAEQVDSREVYHEGFFLRIKMDSRV